MLTTTRVSLLLLGLNLVSCQIDPGCTISCGVWNACRITNWDDLSKCGPEPSGCDCTHFDIAPAANLVPTEIAELIQVKEVTDAPFLGVKAPAKI